MKKIILTASAIAAGAAASAMVVVAHRGENTLAPQNSLESANIAWSNGVKYVEGDFWEIADGEIICIHARGELKKYAGLDADIAKLTMADIAKLDLSNNDKWRGKFKNVKIPTVREIMATVPKDGTLVFEIKNYTPAYAKKVDDARKAAGIPVKNVILISFNAEALRDFKRQFGEYKTLWLYALKNKNGKLNYTPQEAIAKCREINADGVDVGGTPLLGAQYVNEVKAAGLEFYVWTVNKPDDILRMKKLGVDGLTTDTAYEALRLLSRAK